ncbi:MAG: hypothetical protein ACI9EF_003025 [Pseudohongiellaceae bacterium]|jgi:uncharacterized protein YciI
MHMISYRALPMLLSVVLTGALTGVLATSALAQQQDSSSAAQPTVDQPSSTATSDEGTAYTFALLWSGPKEASLTAEEMSTAMAGHFANIKRLGDEGVLLMAGPYGGERGKLRGIFLLDVAETEDAQAHLASDPAIAAEVLEAYAVPLSSRSPLRMIPLLNLGARQARAAQDPSQADAFEGRAYVLAMVHVQREGDAALADSQLEAIDRFLATPAVLLFGDLGDWSLGTVVALIDATDLDDCQGQLDDAQLGDLPWDLNILWASSMVEQLPRFSLHEKAPHFVIETLPESGPRSVFRPGFTRVVDVFGVPVVATANTSDRALLHGAHCLAQYLDNDEDGRIDDERVLAELLNQGAFLAMAEDVDELEDLDVDWAQLAAAGFSLGQDLLGDESHPDGAPHRTTAGLPFDAALEEVLHLVSHGWAAAYPADFSFASGSRLTQAMDLARGGAFRDVPARYDDDAWYHYDDRSCNYECMAAEYFYWTLTSLLGGQAFPGRAEAVSDEWELTTAALLAARDPAIYELLNDPRFALPQQLPDGTYGR